MNIKGRYYTKMNAKFLVSFFFGTLFGYRINKKKEKKNDEKRKMRPTCQRPQPLNFRCNHFFVRELIFTLGKIYNIK